MANSEKISIALPSEMIVLMKQAIDSGAYTSISEIVREALRGWTRERQRDALVLQELRAEIQKGIDSPTAGTAEEVTARVLKRLHQKYGDDTTERMEHKVNIRELVDEPV